MTASETVTPWVLEVRQVSKSFPGVQALDRVRLELAPGEVHAVMGMNGAGKSTLMKILAGLLAPDGGEIWFRGRPIQLRSPHQAWRAGIGMVHQELLPFPELTVAENIFLGQEPVRGSLGWIDRRARKRRAIELLGRLGVSLSPTQVMKHLSVAQMQLVEIAKALAHKVVVLILDEPTSAISDREVEKLFEVIAGLKQQGVAIVYISHKLAEVFRIADRITVLRDGRSMATHPRCELDERSLIALMVGSEEGPVSAQAARAPGHLALTVRGLGKKGCFQDINFELRQGEILGIAGLLGAGRTELLAAIYGLAPSDSGEIFVKGRRVRIARPRDALFWGLGLVNEDRKRQGLVPGMSVKHNLTLSTLRRYCRMGWIDRHRENQVVDRNIQALAIHATHRDQAVQHLSGGNQQKVVIGKALLGTPAVLLLDEPTRGIDVSAKAEVYDLISQLARGGKAILLVSSEFPELLLLSDRLLVLREGRISAELDPRQTTPEELLRYAVPE